MSSTAARELELFSYWRSSSSWRVRIALNVKGIEHKMNIVHLIKDGGEHKKADYAEKNPLQLLPALKVTQEGAEDVFLSESMAIIEYLEETYPETTHLLPSDPVARANARAVASAIACNIQPIQNLKVLAYVGGDDMAKKTEWAKHWISAGLDGLTKLLEKTTKGGSTKYACGDEITIADCFLVPQAYNAVRWQVNMDNYPLIRKIVAECEQLPAFQKAHPDAQPDAVPA